MSDEGLAGAKELLAGKRRLDRDRGLIALHQALAVDEGTATTATTTTPAAAAPTLPEPNSATVFPPTAPVAAGCSDEVLRKAEALALELLQAGLVTDAPWEPLHGGLLAAALVVRTTRATPEFVDASARLATEALSCRESRVRVEAGVTLGVLVAVCGLEHVYGVVARPVILSHIEDNLQRVEAAVDASADPALLEKLGGGTGLSKDVFHESAGWKNLETGARALHEVVKAAGTAFAPHLTRHLLGLLFEALKHSNRFVRETGYYVCSELCGALEPQLAALEGAGSDADGADGDDQPATAEPGSKAAPDTTVITGEVFAVRMATQLATGLSDNWSQVRMAASVASRRFLLALPEAQRERFYEQLLPRICLNRYYVAEGVRLFSQETWRAVVGDRGISLVERYIDATITFYIMQTRADNHAVREAGCACIAELGAKVRTPDMAKHIPDLLQALIEAFNDDSWPVRDAACIASGRFVKCYPEQSAPRMAEFYDLFFQHIGDNIWSVRENAAVALGQVVEAFGADAFAKVQEKIKAFLPSAKDQKATSSATPGLENVTQFGVARPVSPGGDMIDSQQGGPKRIRYKAGESQDPDHENKQLYSCGSLAPKLKRSTGGGCSSSHGHRRAVEPWELTDGCVYLLRELAASYPTEVTAFLPQLAEVARLKHYPHHFSLLETVWKQLPVIAHGIGKRNFKRADRDFVEPLAYTLQCSNHLAKTAAELCVHALAKFLGPNIFKGHVAEVDDRLVPIFEAALLSPPPDAPLAMAVNPGKSFVPPTGRVVPTFGPPGMSGATASPAAIAAAAAAGPRGPVRLV